MQYNQFLTSYNQVQHWLDIANIYDYYINPDTLEVDVNGHVTINPPLCKPKYSDFACLPVKFKHVKGDFKCDNNELTTLHGAPQVVDGNFYCYMNRLTSLQGGPAHVGDDYLCDFNLLINLQGAAQYVGSNFHCEANNLTSLQGAPRIIEKSFLCQFNKLTSLQGGPSIIKKEFIFDANNQTMNNINTFIKSAKILTLNHPVYDLKGLMRIFLIKNIQQILILNPDDNLWPMIHIINKHLQGKRSGPACQIELIDAGFEQYISL